MRRATLISRLTQVLVCFGIFSLSISAMAADAIENIRASGQINIGYRKSSIPLSFISQDTHAPSGYNIDICMKIVDALKEELNLPNLRVNFVLVDVASRIPMLTNNKIDIECGSTTHTKERDKFVLFSLNTIIDEDQALIKKGSNINTIADLDGKTIAVNPSSSVTQRIRVLENNGGYHFNRVFVQDHQEGFDQVESGKAVAYFELRSVLAGLALHSKSPDAYTFLERPLDEQPIAIMMRKDDFSLKAITDRTITKLANDGQLDALYSKWFLKPFDSQGRSLNLPKNPATIRQYINPTDQAMIDYDPIITVMHNLPKWAWGGGIVITYIGCSLIGLFMYLRIWRRSDVDSKFFEYSQTALTSVGGITSLILGFTLLTSLSAFNGAYNHTIEEATAIAVMQKDAASLGPDEQAGISRLLLKYTKIVLDQEWADQADGLPVLSFPGNNTLKELQGEIVRINTTDNRAAATIQGLLLQDMSALYRARTNRLIEAGPQSKVPAFLWAVLFLASAFSIFCSYLIGFRSKTLHYLSVAAISFSFSLSIVVIMLVDRPYLGKKSISSEPFQIVLENFIN